MFWRSPRLKQFLDFDRVRHAIVVAERRTSGEIRVSVAPFFWGSVDRAADRAFRRLRMTETAAHNGVLLFIVPSRRSFVVRGDTAIHERVPSGYWSSLVALITPYFRRGEYTEGVLAGIGALAEELSLYFPYDPDHDRNELPDAIDLARRP
jgi:uncharacterized membrane protein